MRLKYKKIILFISFGTMLIGLVAFSLIPTGEERKSLEAAKSTSTDATPGASAVATGDTSAEPESPFKKNAHPEINELIHQYFNAKMTVDMEAMEELVSDIQQVDERKLQKQLEYIEGIENIDCYTFDGNTEGAYRVYVYHELKIRGVETLAPALTGLYVTQTSEGTYVIYLSTLDDEAGAFIEESDARQEAVALTTDVQNKLNEALSQDAGLKEFYDMLENGNGEAGAE